MGTARELEAVHQDLTQLTKQGKIAGFLTNTENMQRINDLVGKIDEAILDYQVCVRLFISTIPNVCARFHYNKAPTTTLVSSLYVSLPCFLPLRTNRLIGISRSHPS